MCLGRVDAMNHRANWVPLSGIVVGSIALFICCEAEFANSAVRQDRFPSFLKILESLVYYYSRIRRV